MSAIDYCLCIEELARVDPSVALSVAAHNGLGPAHIAMFGSEAQKVRWLMPLAKGEKLGAWALTEPEAGSDAAGTRTVAARDGDNWVLDGTKTFITHGASADVMVVMASTDRSRRRERHLRVRRRARDQGVQRRTQGRQAGHARVARPPRSTSSGAWSPRTRCLGRPGRASSRRCRCWTPAASASPHCPSDWRRAPSTRPATTRWDDGSSVSRSRRFRRFNGSWPTWRRGSTPPVCSRIVRRS